MFRYDRLCIKVTHGATRNASSARRSHLSAEDLGGAEEISDY
jgi:hypothetical protein